MWESSDNPSNGATASPELQPAVWSPSTGGTRLPVIIEVSSEDANLPAASMTAPVAETSFADELARLLADFRVALERLLVTVGSPSTPRQLQRKLGVSYTLSWQVFQVVEGSGGLAAAKHAPTPARLRALIDAAIKSGLDRESAKELVEIAERFRDFMKSHATDRAAFESLIAGVSASSGNDTSSPTIGMQHRRDLFRSLSHIWGKQVDCVYYAWMMAADGPDTRRVCTTCVRSGLRRLRPDAQLVLFGNAESNSSWKPVDESAHATWGMPVLEKFCTTTVPAIERLQIEGGGVVYRMGGSTFGLKGSMTVASAQWAERLAQSLTATTQVVVTQPQAMLVLDWIVERSTYGDLSSKLALDAFETSRPDGLPDKVIAFQRLSLDAQVTPLGAADAAPSVAEVPSWREMTAYTAAKMGWDLRLFDIYRVRIPFPIWGSTVRLALRA